MSLTDNDFVHFRLNVANKTAFAFNFFVQLTNIDSLRVIHIFYVTDFDIYGHKSMLLQTLFKIFLNFVKYFNVY